MLLPSILSSMAEACCSMAHLHQIHAHSITSNLIADRKLLAKLFQFAAISPSRNLLYAHRMFDQIPNRDTFFFNTLIRGFARSSSPSHSISLFNLMRASSVHPDEFTFNFLLKSQSRSPTTDSLEIHGLIIKLGFHSHPFVQNTLIHVYAARGRPTEARKVFGESIKPDAISWSGLVLAHAKAGQIDIARRVFNAMPEKDVVSFTAMITAYSQWKYPNEALELFIEMTDSGLCPDEVTLISVLSACKTSGNLELGIGIHRYIEDNNLNKMTSLSNALIDFYAKCGCLEKAYELFSSTKAKTSITWNVMISAFADHGDLNAAFWVFDEMLKAGNRPDSFTLLALLRGHAKTGLVQESFDLFCNIRRDFNVDARVEHFGCLVSMLCESQRVEDAYKLATEMPFEGNEAIWRTVLRAARTRRYVDIEEDVLKRLLAIKPDDQTYLSLLHDISCVKSNT